MFHDKGGGDLAGVMAAHAVGDHPKALAGLHEVVVFVELANATLVAYTEALIGQNDRVQAASTLLCLSLPEVRPSAPLRSNLPQPSRLEY
jgi:hypothetical protein